MPHGSDGDDRGRPTDAELVAAFRSDPAWAWERFLGRYAGFMVGELRRSGFPHDDAMDAFVYVCEKLAERRFRRLAEVRSLGRDGELVPWLRTVTRNLAINWVWSREGRKRLLTSISRLPPLAQRVYQLSFGQGMKPSEVLGELRREGRNVSVAELFDALEAVHGALSENRLGHLAAELARSRGPLELDAPTDSGAPPELPSREPDPEAALLARERDREIAGALEALSDRGRLLVALRYEDGLGDDEIAAIVGSERREVAAELRTALGELRRRLSNSSVRASA